MYLHAVDVHKSRLSIWRQIGQNLDEMTAWSEAGTAVGHGELFWGCRTRRSWRGGGVGGIARLYSCIGNMTRRVPKLRTRLTLLRSAPGVVCAVLRGIHGVVVLGSVRLVLVRVRPVRVLSSQSGHCGVIGRWHWVRLVPVYLALQDERTIWTRRLLPVRQSYLCVQIRASDWILLFVFPSCPGRHKYLKC